MNKSPVQQKGASLIGNIIILAIVGYAAYIGIQYVPQLIESKSIDSILRSVKDAQNTDPVDNVADAQAMVIRLLQVNEMNDMTDSFSVSERGGKITIAFKYDRELNLGYEKRPMHYEKTMILD